MSHPRNSNNQIKSSASSGKSINAAENATNKSAPPAGLQALLRQIISETGNENSASERERNKTARDATNNPAPSDEQQTLLRQKSRENENEIQRGVRLRFEEEQKAKNNNISKTLANTQPDTAHHALTERELRVQRYKEASLNSARKYAKQHPEKIYGNTQLITPRLLYTPEVKLRIKARANAAEKEREQHTQSVTGPK